MLVGLRYAIASDEGGDWWSVNADSGYAGSFLLAIADGADNSAGAAASAIAISTLRRFDVPVPDTELQGTLTRAVAEANAGIGELRPSPTEKAETSLTALLWNGTARFAIAHIGDTRAYLLRDNVLFQITSDHTMAQLLADGGDRRESSHLADQLFKSLDGGPDREPDQAPREALPGDVYLLCTKGLTRPVGPQEIFDVLSDSRLSREQKADDLIRRAGAHGIALNITCIVADVVAGKRDFRPSPPVAAGAVVDEDVKRRVLRSDPSRSEPQRPFLDISPMPPPAPEPARKPVPAPTLRGFPPPDFEISGFDVMEPLGHGGFATVYRATQRSLKRPVAVKVLHERLRGEGQRRFEREVDAVLRLSGHPNVITIYDRGELPDGRPYLVMEYCPGGSLADRLSRGTLPPDEVLRIGVKAADALAAAHREGILHRDLKPDNLLVTRFEPVALADFGIAKVVDPDGNMSATVKAATPAYAPPELFDEDYSPTETGDVYSLGASLYALLSGNPPRHPAKRLSGYALMAHHFQARDLPIPDIPGVPRGLMSAIQGSLRRDLSRRHRDADAFLSALRAVRL